MPYFDPLDGGIQAECLFLFEAAGPRAVESGFISRNNPDETAKNWFELNQQAGFPRERTISWNVVPWYIGDDSRIRAARRDDVQRGLPYLHRLLSLLPRLRIIVLCGRNAQLVESEIRDPKFQLFKLPHPSPLYVNNAPGNRDKLLRGLVEIRRALEDGRA